MSIQLALFFGFAALATLSAIWVILAKNPVHSVLSLVFTFLTTAVTWLLVESEFLAVALVLIYVGAVMVLFLFVVMMLEREAGNLHEGLVRYYPLAMLMALTVLGGLIYMIMGPAFTDMAPTLIERPADYSGIAVLGERLFTAYLLPFEVAGLLLFVAIVAAIVLTHRAPRSSKAQQVSEQVRVTKEERLKIISMPSEAKGSKS